ncbi:MAG: hypothetical protein WAM09_14895 [Anaerolineales bacterium]
MSGNISPPTRGSSSCRISGRFGLRSVDLQHAVFYDRTWGKRSCQRGQNRVCCHRLAHVQRLTRGYLDRALYLQHSDLAQIGYVKISES